MKYFWTLFLTFFSLFLFAQKPDVVLTTGHRDMISDIVVSPDGKYIVTSSIDKSFKITELSSGKELRTVSGFSQRVQFIKISADSRYLVCCIEGEALEVYSFPSCQKIKRIETDKASFDFLDSTSLAYINSNSMAATLNFKNDEVKEAPEGEVIMNLDVNNVTKEITAYNLKGELLNLNSLDLNVVKRVPYFDAYKYFTCEMQVSPDGKLLAFTVDKTQNGVNGTVHLLDAQSLKKLAEFETKESRIFDFTFDVDSKRLIAVEHNGNIIFYDLNKKVEEKRVKRTVFSPMTLCTHPKEELIFVPEMNAVHVLDNQDAKILKTYKAQGNKIVNMSYDQKGKYLVSSTLDLKLKIWNLELNKIEHSIFGFFPVAFYPNGGHFVSMATASELAEWDPETGQKTASFKTDNELIQNLSFSSDGRYMSGAGYFGILKVWDTKTKELLWRFTGHSGGIYSSCFSPDGKLLVSTGMDNTIRVWDLKTGKEIQKMDQHQIIVSDSRFTPDGKFLICSSWDKTVSIWNTKDWALVKQFEAHSNMITSIDVSADGKYLVTASGNNSVWEADNSVKIWDIATGNMLCQLKGHTGTIHKVCFDKLGTLLYSSGDDGMIKVWDYKTCKEVASMVSVGDNDYIITTPDNYYLSSKNALDAVAFRIGNELYPFEQFDLKLNRPDIICSRLGKTPPNLIKAYEFVHQKRIKRMGYEEKDLEASFDLPLIEVLSSNIPLMTANNKLSFKVKANGKGNALKFLMVSNNGAPQFGAQGLAVEGVMVEKEITLDLVPGTNEIHLSVFNQKGEESLKKSLTIVYNSQQQQGDLYLITIGVSEYNDSRYSLKYAAKDARDILATLEQNKTLYKGIFSKSLIDKEVTIENVKGLTAFLANAKREDMVLIFIAGHGVLDEKFDYYYATSDIDFENPSARGIPYDVFELLLSNCKANKKMLLMDTCHSGELDKEEIEKAGERKVKTEEEVQFRAVGEAVVQKSAFGVENTTELMQDLFTDFNNETGATVISSSGGAEFSMESSQWKNGLFTYCFLNGIQSYQADVNFDRQIVLSEIRKYVYDKVSELSKGMQKPGTRAENLVADYRLW